MSTLTFTQSAELRFVFGESWQIAREAVEGTFWLRAHDSVHMVALTLGKAGVAAEDVPAALVATRGVADRALYDNPSAWSEDNLQAAAEFVAAANAITGQVEMAPTLYGYAARVNRP